MSAGYTLTHPSATHRQPVDLTMVDMYCHDLCQICHVRTEILSIIYHHFLVLLGSTSPSISQPTNGKRSSMLSIIWYCHLGIEADVSDIYPLGCHFFIFFLVCTDVVPHTWRQQWDELCNPKACQCRCSMVQPVPQ